MKTLIQYLFEATVNTADLENNLKFEETDIDDILDILDTDEYNHFVELCGERYTKKQVQDGVFLLKYSTHFKIMYEGTLLGIFSVCLPENFKDLLRNNGLTAGRDLSQLGLLFCPFLNAAIDGEPYDILDKHVYTGLVEDYLERVKYNSEKIKEYSEDIQKYETELKEYTKKLNDLQKEYDKYHDSEIKRQINNIQYKIQCVETIDLRDAKCYKTMCERLMRLEKNDKLVKTLVERIMSITGFVVIWQLSKDAKKKIDVNQIALLKIFFQKLTELIKNAGANYIIAQGKDEHVTNAYIKLGGFNSTEELFNKYATDYDEEYHDFISGTVIKQI
jgi:hypothetical protein